MNKRELQHELLSDLTYSISEVFHYTDFTPTEQLSFVVAKIRNSKVDAEQLDLRNTVNGLASITERLNNLRGMKKTHKLPTRIKSIIEDIKW